MSWGAVAGAVAGSVASYGLSQIDGGDSPGTPGGVGTWQAPQYSWTEPSLKLLSDYSTRGLQQVQEGRYPDWFSNLMPQLKEGLKRGEYESVFGIPGQRTGQMQAATEVGAMGGVGPKALTAQTNKVLLDWKKRNRSIDEYLAAMGMDVMQNAEQRYMEAIRTAPSGPNAQPYTYAGTPGSTQWSDTVKQFTSAMPWEKLGNWMVGPKTTPTSTPINPMEYKLNTPSLSGSQPTRWGQYIPK